MYHPVRKRMSNVLINTLILITLTHPQLTFTKFIDSTEANHTEIDDSLDNNIIDFEEDVSIKLNKKYGILPWNDNYHEKDAFRYTVVAESKIKNDEKLIKSDKNSTNNLKKIKSDIESDINKTDNASKSDTVVFKSKNKTFIFDNVDNTNNKSDETTTQDYSVIPLELISTTQNVLISIIESTTEPDLTVIPLSTTVKIPKIDISDTVTLPTSTQAVDVSTTTEIDAKTNENIVDTTEISTKSTTSNESITQTTDTNDISTENYEDVTKEVNETTTSSTELETTTIIQLDTSEIETGVIKTQNITTRDVSTTENDLETSTEYNETTIDRLEESKESDTDVPIYTELDAIEEVEVPEDYYDAKDIIPTTAPRTDALSVIFGLAGTVVESVVESVAERVVPKGIVDLFRRMQRQSEALEAEKLRSREENGGIGKFYFK